MEVGAEGSGGSVTESGVGLIHDDLLGGVGDEGSDGDDGDIVVNCGDCVGEAVDLAEALDLDALLGLWSVLRGLLEGEGRVAAEAARDAL